jgi:hypothetical protein
MMSAIDQYKHDCIGIINFPLGDGEVVGLAFRNIPIYKLKQDIPSNEKDFDGKNGDILLGGGSGENSALRISIPQAFFLYTSDDWDDFESHEEIYKAFWTPTESYVFCDGYKKLGWNPRQVIEVWLLEHLLAFLKNNYFDEYTHLIGNIELACDGSICRLPTNEELSANGYL